MLKLNREMFDFAEQVVDDIKHRLRTPDNYGLSGGCFLVGVSINTFNDITFEAVVANHYVSCVYTYHALEEMGMTSKAAGSLALILMQEARKRIGL